MLERGLSGDIAGGYRSRGLEKPVLARGLTGDEAAGDDISRGLERLCWREISGDIAAGGYRSSGLEKPVLER